ncbi:MAG TPA: MFS transporter [Fimbriimonas sp.]|nr:MFS transporter [Fimbriimonas sp.]
MKKVVEPTPTDSLTTGEAAAVAEAIPGGSERNPWWFVPSLYFMQGVPVVVVQQLSVTMYKKMGVSNAEIGLWTSLIAWPWIAKMLWGPLVEHNGTRRGWIIATQALIILGLAVAAMTLQTSAFLALSLVTFFVIAFFSATHDIAADGFYLLAQNEKQQAAFVGIRSAFFRLAMIFCTGVLVGHAGELEKKMAIPEAWTRTLFIATLVYGLLWAYGLFALPKPKSDSKEQPVNVPIVLLRFGQIVLMLVAVILLGRLTVIGASGLNNVFSKPVFTKSIELTPLFLPAYEGHPHEVIESRAGDLMEKSDGKVDENAAIEQAEQLPKPFIDGPPLAAPIQFLGSILIIAFACWSTKRLFVGIGMGPAAREYFARERIVPILAFILFYRFGESMLGKMSSPFLLDPQDKGGLGIDTQSVGVIIGTVGVLGLTIGGLLGGVIIARWGIKRVIWPMVLALNVPNLFYVWLAYAKPASPLSEHIKADQLPFWNVAADGPVWTFADYLAYVPAQLYNVGVILWQSVVDPVGQVIFIDQFGYGFGFSAYMVYLMFISQGSKHRTSNYAISTGLMALGAMIAGITSGYLQEFCKAQYGGSLSYYWFFIGVVICTIPGMITLFFIPMDREDIKVSRVDID